MSDRKGYLTLQSGPFTRIPEQLVPIATLTNSAATYYTAPAATVAVNAVGMTPRVEAREFWIANITGSPETITVHIVPAAGSATAANAIMYAVTVAANTSYQVVGRFVLKAGDTIQALAGSNSTINLGVSGDVLIPTVTA